MFELNDDDVQAVVAEGQRCAAQVPFPRPAVSALGPAEMVALFLSNHPTDELRQAAILARSKQVRALEAFSPLYLTNTCDAECRMCGMRRDNQELVRETATPHTVRAQLERLRMRGVVAVALLTGEYRRETRAWSIGLTREALSSALDLGFRHVLINIGSLNVDEFSELLRDAPRDQSGRVTPKVTMCTFQETYDRSVYAKFMGSSADNPRADFERRLGNFDRAAEAGMRVVNPGVLLGLCTDVTWELAAAALHVRYLLERSLEVYLSVPRLRQAKGVKNGRGVSDDQFIRLLTVLALGLPEAKLVLTTREPSEIQRAAIPLVSVLSAGSSAVAPYTESGAKFPLEASQFEVIDQRPFEEIYGGFLADGIAFENYKPAS